MRSRESVIAIVVAAGNDVRHAHVVCEALARQSVLPDRVIVALPSQPSSDVRDILLRTMPEGRLCIANVAGAKNFGQAIARSLTSFQATGEEKEGWLWLVHADSVPEPNTLEKMLDKGESSAKIGVVGPKQVAHSSHPDDPFLLKEVGIRATRTARRVPELRVEERDQGQYDTREDMLGIGSAGMLVRHELWKRLGGFNPDLGPYGDGLEFCRRVWLAGYRVVVEPQALIVHGRHSLERGGDLAQSFGERRRAQIFNALLAAPAPCVPFLWIAYVLLAFPRAIVRLLWRDSVRARGELYAGVHTIAACGAVMRGRRKIARIHGDQRALRHLESSAAQVREAKRLARRAEEETEHVCEENPLDVQARRDLRMHTRRGLCATVLIGIVLSALLHVPYLSFGTLTGGALGTDWSTAQDLWAAAWQGWHASGDGSPGMMDAYWLLFIPILLLGAPWGLTLGQVVTASLYCAPVLAGVCAYLAAGKYTKSSVLRTGMSMMWMISPPFLEALMQGRSAALAVHILLPLALNSFVGAWRAARLKRAGTADGALAQKTPEAPEGKTPEGKSAKEKSPAQLGSSSYAGYVGAHKDQAHIAGIYIGCVSLILALLTAATALFACIALLLAIIGFLGSPHARKRWLWVPVPSLALLLPAVFTLGTSWRAWLAYLCAQPGIPYGTSAEPGNVLHIFTSLTWSADPSPAQWVLMISLGILLLAGIASLLRTRVAGTVWLAWILIIAAMAIAVACVYIPVGIHTYSGLMQPVAAWSGIALSLVWLGLFIAISAAANGVRAGLRRIHVKPLTALAALLGVLMPASMVSLAGAWIYLQWASPDHVLSADSRLYVPAVGATEQDSSHKARVLAIDATMNGYDVQLWRGNGLAMHELSTAAQALEAARTFPLSRSGITPQEKYAQSFDDAEQSLTRALANVGAAGESVAQELSQHAVSVIVLPPPTDSTDLQARAQLRAYLNAVPGLEYITENDTGAFWRISAQTPPARIRIVDSDGESQPLASEMYGAHTHIDQPDSNDRYLVLAERAGRGWKAQLDGESLEPLSRAERVEHHLPVWAQAWKVPAGSDGELEVGYRMWPVVGIRIVQALMMLVALGAALPIRSRKEDVA